MTKFKFLHKYVSSKLLFDNVYIMNGMGLTINISLERIHEH